MAAGSLLAVIALASVRWFRAGVAVYLLRAGAAG
jgi:hypothetical protein